MNGGSGGSGGNRFSILPETLAFYSWPADYMDPSWWQSNWLPEELFERLKQNRRSRPHLSGFLLKRLGLTDDSLFHCRPAHIDLALTPRPRLNRLVTLAGITLLSAAIAGVLRRDERSRIKVKLGEQDYDFAIRRGRLLAQQARLTKAIPDAGPLVVSEVDKESLRLGIAGLATALQNASQPLVRRTQLKLPRVPAEAYWQPLIPTSEEFLRLFRSLGRQVEAL